MTNKPNAIIFDWDNTLIDTWEILLKAMNETFITYGMQAWTLEEMKSKCFKSMRDVFPSLFGARWEEAGELYRNTYKLKRADELKFLPYALELLEFLHNKTDIYLAIVSNKASEILKEEIKMLKADKYFSKLIGSGDAPEDKPSSLPLQYALEGSHINLNSKVWYVGDTQGDMECAHNANCAQIFYGRDFNDTIKATYPNVLYMENHRSLLKYITAL